MNISPLAVVHPEAKIGQNTTVDPFAVIEKDVVIGDNCRIYSHATILDGARIGNNCQVFPGAVIAGIPQDLKFKGEITTAEIGNNLRIHILSWLKYHGGWEPAIPNGGSAYRPERLSGGT